MKRGVPEVHSSCAHFWYTRHCTQVSSGLELAKGSAHIMQGHSSPSLLGSYMVDGVPGPLHSCCFPPPVLLPIPIPLPFSLSFPLPSKSRLALFALCSFLSPRELSCLVMTLTGGERLDRTLMPNLKQSTGMLSWRHRVII